jgi:hypothetical protein
MLSLIAYGEDIATNSAPKSREEWASKLDSILLRGAPFAVIDNIVGSFASDDFASVLTSAKRTVRIKGLSKVVDVPVNTVWVLNGNDLTLDSDLSQRLIICHLQHEDPSSRKQEKFQIQQKYGCSIEVLLRQERAKYMQACLDLICGWVNDGAPRRKKLALAKYGEWESVIGGIIDWIAPQAKNHREHRRRVLPDWNGWLLRGREPCVAADARIRQPGGSHRPALLRSPGSRGFVERRRGCRCAGGRRIPEEW